LAAINNQEQDIPIATANTRAAQMLAEMLAIVCHPEYYQQGEQTVLLPQINVSTDLTCRLLSFILPDSRPLFIGLHFLPITCAKSILAASTI
jgi:hypothetical protein